MHFVVTGVYIYIYILNTFYVLSQYSSIVFFVVQITSIPFVHNVGPLHLSTEPVKHFLEGLATRRKVKYASLLHERARVSV